MKNTTKSNAKQPENINSPHVIPGDKPAGLLNTASTDKQLRSKVKLLGTLLGNVLLSNAGAKLYDAVEKLRVGFIELHKEEDAQKREHLMTLIASLDEETLTQVVRAFSTYFSLVNVEEEASQLQIRRRQIRDGEGTTVRVTMTSEAEAALESQANQSFILLGTTSRYVFLYSPRDGESFIIPTENIAALNPENSSNDSSSGQANAPSP